MGRLRKAKKIIRMTGIGLFRPKYEPGMFWLLLRSKVSVVTFIAVLLWLTCLPISEVWYLLLYVGFAPVRTRCWVVSELMCRSLTATFAHFMAFSIAFHLGRLRSDF